MLALAILAVTGLVLLKGAINIIVPRQWTLNQNISDAYLTYEKAYAERIDFGDLTDSDSPWPVYPAKSLTAVTLGTLPGGRTVTGEIIRTRIPDSNNLPAFGGSGTLETNPAEMQVWKLQSHLLYSVNGKDYVKSRTVVRNQ